MCELCAPTRPGLSRRGLVGAMSAAMAVAAAGPRHPLRSALTTRWVSSWPAMPAIASQSHVRDFAAGRAERDWFTGRLPRY